MGFSRKRAGKDGRPRYTAYYRDLKDRECSAGTFGSKRDADKAWQRAEAKVAEGRLGDPGRGRQTFQAYVEQVWLPGHQIEATTRPRGTAKDCMGLDWERGSDEGVWQHLALSEQVRT